jgi:hypothetical protein
MGMKELIIKYHHYVEKREAKGRKPKDFESWREWRREKKRLMREEVEMSAEQEQAPVETKAERTVRVFVEEMFAKGRKLRGILAVAQSSRWHGHKDEIREIYHKLKKSRK